MLRNQILPIVSMIIIFGLVGLLFMVIGDFLLNGSCPPLDNWEVYGC